MHAALNAHLLSFGPSYRGAGISRYIRQLLTQLRRWPGADEFTVFLGDSRIPPELSGTSSFRLRVSRLPTVNPMLRVIWEQLVQATELRGRAIDLLHSLGYVQPLLCPCRSVVTIHDLSFLRYPEAFNRPNRLYLQLFTALSVRRADRIIAVSTSTKDDLVRLLGVVPSKVTVVHHGVEDDFRQLSDRAVLASFRERTGLPEHFILHFGTLEPRKNVELLVAAYARMRQQSNLPHKLVLAGAKGWRYDRIFAAVEQYGLQDDVLFPGYLPSSEQPLWYNAADVFVYPSLYEGFGFPPLEAMACGTPLIASDRSALPEVVGDAGLLVDPLDVALLAETLHRVLTNSGLRQDLVERGLARAKMFSWLRAARETVEVYHRT